MAKSAHIIQTILGVDPGTNFLGFAVLQLHASGLHIGEIGILQLDKFAEPAAKLRRIFDNINRLMDTYHPGEVAIEAPFFGKNVQSMLKLGRAQGVVMAAALRHDVNVCEYSPRRVKQSIAGNGNASKHQVAIMLQQTFPEFPFEKEKYDHTDALAVAVCHHYTLKSSIAQIGKPSKTSSSKKTSWAQFVQENPQLLHTGQ